MSRHHDLRIRPARAKRFAWPAGGGVRQHRELVILSLVSLVLLSALYAQTQAVLPPPLHEGPSAVIIDQLDASMPNRTFVQRATTTLEEAGYVVDHYAGGDVDVGFYQRLPAMGYDVILIRTHSSANLHNGGKTHVSLFTNEPYSHQEHIRAQYQGLLGNIRHTAEQYIEDPTRYFSVQPRLIERARGDFDGAVVFVMGCQSLADDSMANAFLRKGASAYVGWDLSVTAGRNDAATLAWLEAWLGSGADPTRAVEDAMEAVGEDPVYGSQLRIMQGATA